MAGAELIVVMVAEVVVAVVAVMETVLVPVLVEGDEERE